MKKKKMVLFSMLGVLLLLLVASVYAHSGSQEKVSSNGMMLSVEGMNEVHSFMIKDIDSDLKNEFDYLHDSCISHFKEQ